MMPYRTFKSHKQNIVTSSEIVTEILSQYYAGMIIENSFTNYHFNHQCNGGIPSEYKSPFMLVHDFLLS